MSHSDYIPVPELCKHYCINQTFFEELHDKGVLEIVSIAHTNCLHHESIPIFEKIVRISEELHINIEGIDVILNLLDTVDDLRSQLTATQNRLRLYE
ncbi:chaperone modulator CbpM [Leeuwenhoekiella sp. W20_SRS_FM14]|uniref:chaperone modulator CbpM n=1 Tax=Leeuwenhoekiella sp. W20_SRS_FM14 TaxID=3240270 RepID=UPI003F99A448